MMAISGCCATAAVITYIMFAPASAQTAREVVGAAPVEPLQNEPPAKIVINGVPPEPHKILIQVVNANHKPIDRGVVLVTVPKV